MLYWRLSPSHVLPRSYDRTVTVRGLLLAPHDIVANRVAIVVRNVASSETPDKGAFRVFQQPLVNGQEQKLVIAPIYYGMVNTGRRYRRGEGN
jgi:hypothetical protein